MKSFFRNLSKLSLVSFTLLSSTFLGNFSALALPEEQVLQKLNPVPVFGLTDDQGSPLLFQVADNPKAARMRVFVSPQDAQNFVTELKNKDPEIGNNFDNITPIPLGKIYQIAMENKDKDKLFFSFQAEESEVNSAVSIIEKENPSGEEWKGVPLFFATVKQNDQEAYLPTEQGKIPLFFEKETLQKQLEQLKVSQPDIAGLVHIKVVRLEDMIGIFQSQDDNSLRNMILVPSTESIRFVQSTSK